MQFLSKFRPVPHLARLLLLTGILSAGFGVGALAQEPAPPSAGGVATTAPQVKSTSAWEMIKHGGPSLVLLGICSVATLTLIIERFMFYRKAGGSSEAIVAKIKEANTLSEALEAIQSAPGISGRILRKAIEAARDGYSPENVEQLVQGEVTKELMGMERFLPQLDSMVTMCPLIGLAGTTLGMIRSFSIVAAVGMNNPQLLAGGISEALVNTATGLLMAIPALFCYNWFTGKKEMILMDMEKGLSELMVILKSSVGHGA